MIDVLLNIALLVLGTTATLAAFGGKTWVEGSEPLLHRIKLRGWISLSCLAAALLFGVVKETRSFQGRKKASDAAEADRRRLKETRDALAEARTKLDELQLALVQQSETGLLTVLAQGAAIKEGGLSLNTRAGADPPRNDADYLFPALPERYREIATFRVHLRGFMGINSFAYRQWPEARTVPDSLIASAEPVIRISDAATFGKPHGLGQPPDGQAWIGKTLSSRDKLSSAAIAYRDLAAGAMAGEIRLSLSRRFRSKADRLSFKKRFPELRTGMFSNETADGAADVTFPMPEQIRKAFQDYWARAFKDGSMNLYLSAPSYLMMSSDVRLDFRNSGFTIEDTDAVVNFWSTGKPRIVVGIQEI